MHETCSVCGRAADPQVDGDPPLTWSAERGAPDANGAVEMRRACPRCTRENVRAIEAKLDAQWW